jgi:hypothetical protein
MAETTPQSESDFYSIGFALLAIFYAFKIEEAAKLEVDDCLLLFMGFMGASTVLLDYLQYLFGYAMARAAMKTGTFDSKPASTWFGWKTIAFCAKQATAIAGALALLVIVLLA